MSPPFNSHLISQVPGDPQHSDTLSLECPGIEQLIAALDEAIGKTHSLGKIDMKYSLVEFDLQSLRDAVHNEFLLSLVDVYSVKPSQLFNLNRDGAAGMDRCFGSHRGPFRTIVVKLDPADKFLKMREKEFNSMHIFVFRAYFLAKEVNKIFAETHKWAADMDHEGARVNHLVQCPELD
ncbi:hypothetical protein BJ508DRAFT_15908 [Ascobolus immersus RN42]|uniref:Uncharacterized protein n=1 Tax=Ascobolus immersus RN42 TaxID=1160509 RepID=A0A3N4HV25_ASCIM|nr:hypothetical protein BJ508DRAFT_15908 [Ascobolus immersus RN42]